MLLIEVVGPRFLYFSFASLETNAKTDYALLRDYLQEGLMVFVTVTRNLSRLQLSRARRPPKRDHSTGKTPIDSDQLQACGAHQLLLRLRNVVAAALHTSNIKNHGIQRPLGTKRGPPSDVGKSRELGGPKLAGRWHSWAPGPGQIFATDGCCLLFWGGGGGGGGGLKVEGSMDCRLSVY